MKKIPNISSNSHLYSIPPMATLLRPTFPILTFSSPKRKPLLPKSPICISIRSGPRSKRGPLVKGRILSTEAIHAIQSLKRAQRQSPDLISNPSNLPNLARLIKTDLLAILRELLRQDQCLLALHVLSILRAEYKADLTVFADVIAALARNKMNEHIDRLIDELEKEDGLDWEEEIKGLVKVIKGVIAAERKEATVRIWGMLRRSGWKGDEYTATVLSRGLRRMGKQRLAYEVEREFGGIDNGNLEKLSAYELRNTD